MTVALAGLNPDQIDWLTDKNSLTQRLRTFTRDFIQLHILYDDWGMTESNQEAWIRRIEWKHGEDIWITATVIIPDTSITPETEELTRIGNRAIGEILFRDPTLTRSDFTFYKEKSGWLRESVFYYKQKPIFISEYFHSLFLDVVSS